MKLGVVVTPLIVMVCDRKVVMMKKKEQIAMLSFLHEENRRLQDENDALIAQFKDFATSTGKQNAEIRQLKFERDQYKLSYSVAIQNVEAQDKEIKQLKKNRIKRKTKCEPGSAYILKGKE